MLLEGVALQGERRGWEVVWLCVLERKTPSFSGQYRYMGGDVPL